MNFDWRDVLWLVLLFPSITLHEFMHAFAAYRLGDPTAKNAGRLTLNPLKHIDPWGTVALPLLLMLVGAPIFGYAKPVPYNPHAFKDVRKGDLIVGLAGPSANLLLALVGGAIAWAAIPLYSLTDSNLVGEVAYTTGYLLAQTNLVLMFFNLIPIPPLDGSSIITIFMPDAWLRGWYTVQRYSFAILFALLFILPRATGFDPLDSYFLATVVPVLKLLTP